MWVSPLHMTPHTLLHLTIPGLTTDPGVMSLVSPWYLGSLLTELHSPRAEIFYSYIIFFNFMFHQLLCVQHSCSSTQSWGSVLPSIVETRDQNSRGCPLLFLNRNLGSFCAYGTEILYSHSLWEVVDHSRSKMHETCLIIIHDPAMRLGPEYTWGTLD